MPNPSESYVISYLDSEKLKTKVQVRSGSSLKGDLTDKTQNEFRNRKARRRNSKSKSKLRKSSVVPPKKGASATSDFTSQFKSRNLNQRTVLLYESDDDNEPFVTLDGSSQGQKLETGKIIFKDRKIRISKLTSDLEPKFNLNWSGLNFSNEPGENLDQTLKSNVAVEPMLLKLEYQYAIYVPLHEKQALVSNSDFQPSMYQMLSKDTISKEQAGAFDPDPKPKILESDVDPINSEFQNLKGNIDEEFYVGCVINEGSNSNNRDSEAEILESDTETVDFDFDFEFLRDQELFTELSEEEEAMSIELSGAEEADVRDQDLDTEISEHDMNADVQPLRTNQEFSTNGSNEDLAANGCGEDLAANGCGEDLAANVCIENIAANRSSDQDSEVEIPESNNTNNELSPSSEESLRRLRICKKGHTDNNFKKQRKKVLKTKSNKGKKESNSLAAKNDSGEYFIDKIVGYHRDKENINWYLVTWKGYSKKHKTWELMENLTNCNYMLMKHFEFEKPSKKKITEIEKEVENSLKYYSIYQTLKENNFSKKYLNEFSQNYIDLSQLFSAESSTAFMRKMKREYNYILRTLIGMCNHRDWKLFQRAQNYNIFLKLCEMRKHQFKNVRQKLPQQSHTTGKDFCYFC